VSAIIVAYGAEPWLEDAVAKCLASTAVDVEVVVVDNGCTDGATDRLRSTPGVIVVDAGGNSGFAGGCDIGVARSHHEVVALVNPDALVEPGALAALAEVARRPSVGIATASIRLADRPELLNSAGNEIHPSGVSWSGSFEEPAASRAAERRVMAASGCACALRREVWDALGGFDERFFAYYEDADLSLRCHQLGLDVVFCPAAVVHHRYEFARRPEKFELLERNRLMMVLSCYATRTLLVLAPMLLTVEIGLVAMAVKEGWWHQKLAGWRWLWSHRREVAARRAEVQRSRRVGDESYAALFSDDLLPGNLPPPAWFRPVNQVLRFYWRIARRLL
jgi:GT2 family glycosyltransferase